MRGPGTVAGRGIGWSGLDRAVLIGGSAERKRPPAGQPVDDETARFDNNVLKLKTRSPITRISRIRRIGQNGEIPAGAAARACN